MRITLLNLFIALMFAASNTSGQSGYFSISVNTTKATCTGGRAVIKVGGGEAPYYFNWNNGLQGDTENNLLPGNYTISIVDGTGRDTVIHLTILKDKCAVTANTTFSPNGDDINDTWKLSNIEFYPNFTLEIFNRWGQLIHQQTGEFKAWDGKHLGVDVPVGTYYWIFYYDGKDGESEQGSVTLMR